MYINSPTGKDAILKFREGLNSRFALKFSPDVGSLGSFLINRDVTGQGETTVACIDRDTGLMGIGCTNPDFKLSVKSDSSTQAIFGQDKTSGDMQIAIGEENSDNRKALMVGFNHTDDYGYLQLSGDSVGSGLVVDSTGITARLGIGVTSPTEKLDVNGNIRTSGRLLIASGNAPGSSKGLSGDKAGMIAWGDMAGTKYFFLCIADYTTGLVDIWQRVALSGGSW